jgi:hypothetical protein
MGVHGYSLGKIFGTQETGCCHVIREPLVIQLFGILSISLFQNLIEEVKILNIFQNPLYKRDVDKKA